MRCLLPILLLLPLACGPSAPQEPTTGKPLNFDWLLGHWQRGDDKPGQVTFESWDKRADDHYTGFSFRMAGQDTVWQETMHLLAKDGTWILEVSGEGEVIPFTLRETNPQGFRSNNPVHDFPKEINYQLRGDSLYAVIAGGGQEIPFTFGRR